MVDRREATETRLYGAAVRCREHAQELVEVGIGADPSVCLDERVDEIAGYHEDVDSSVVALVSWAAGLGVRRAGADGDAVVDVLEEVGRVLWRDKRAVSISLDFYMACMRIILTRGRKPQAR